MPDRNIPKGSYATSPAIVAVADELILRAHADLPADRAYAVLQVAFSEVVLAYARHLGSASPAAFVAELARGTMGAIEATAATFNRAPMLIHAAHSLEHMALIEAGPVAKYAPHPATPNKDAS
ncbi:MAG: hypothetical protein GC155_06125 [Alphaproteobacteria bacterium]|nr:hypothetical protein [Alphaproteobacteria bacterium]